MFIPDNSILWIPFFGNDTFMRDDHYPVLAGIQKDGTELYITAVSDNELGLQFLTTVANGASSVTYVDASGETRIADDFFVLVLRYTPRQPSPEGHDPTDPLSWREFFLREDPTLGELFGSSGLKVDGLETLLEQFHYPAYEGPGPR